MMFSTKNKPPSPLLSAVLAGLFAGPAGSVFPAAAFPAARLGRPARPAQPGLAWPSLAQPGPARTSPAQTAQSLFGSTKKIT